MGPKLKKINVLANFVQDNTQNLFFLKAFIHAYIKILRYSREKIFYC